MANQTYIPAADGSGYYAVTVADGALSLSPAPAYVAPTPGVEDTTTYGALVRAALIELGVRAPGEAITASEMQDGLARLRLFMRSLNLEPLMSYTEEIYPFTTVAGKQTYTLGSGGDWDIPRPVKIDRAFYTLPNSSPAIEYEMLGPVEDETWGRIAIKTLPLTYPAVIYNRGDYPLTQVSLWPIPQMASTITLHARNKIPAASDQNGIVVLPEGYEELLMLGLAIRLATSYERVPADVTVATYNELKANIKRANMPEIAVEQDEITGNAGSSFVNRRAFLSGGLVK